MTKNQKAVIIGAGVGGIATAIILARHGFQVEVFEKNAQPGGRCGQILQEGHRFDLGATILMMPSVYRQVFAELGVDMDQELEPIPLDPVYKLLFHDGTSLSFSGDQQVMENQLEAMETGSYQAYRKYISEGYTFFEMAMKDLLGRNFNSLFSFVTPKNILLLLKLKAYRRQSRYVRRFFRDHRLQMAFTFQNIYVGQHPYKAPAFFSMLPAAEVIEGALFPKGGMYRIVEKLTECATQLGVTIHCKRAVKSIMTNGSSVEGVVLKNGAEVKADIVIGNADLPYIYRRILKDKQKSRQLSRKKYACSAIVFHWGLKKVYPQLEHHTIFLNEPFRAGLDAIFTEKSLSDNPSFYVHAPTRSDPAAAPDNQDSLSVIVPVAHLDEKADQDWKDIRKKARAAVIRRLQEAGLTDIEEQIKFEICYHPKTWEKFCHVTRGSVFGSLSHDLLQMGYFRPGNRHRKFKNLYFTGGSTHPGNGVPLVLLSAKHTAGRILHDVQRGEKLK